MKSAGIVKKGKINTENGKFRIVKVTAKTISPSKMKIISIAKTLLASVKIAPLYKNS